MLLLSTWMRRGTAGLLALMVMLTLAACAGGDDGGSTPATPALGTLSGRVLASADSAAVADATVAVGERSTRTAADGSFTLTQVPAAARAVLRVSATGYVDALVATPVTANTTLTANASLLREAAAQSFDAANAAVVTTSGSAARVELPAASLVNDATGAAASGTVSVSVTPLDPARDPATMPGDYSVSDTQRIESFGAIKVNLRDAAGNKLNLKSGATATIRIPLSTRGGTPPASIPLYWFNETTGRWVQDGSATLTGTAPSQYYEGQVSHFTYWNADMPQDTIYVNGCVADETGKRLADAMASTSGIDYSGNAYAVSGSDGAFRVAIRKGGKASLWAELGGNVSNTVVVGPSQVDITLPDCLVISSAAKAPVVVQPPADFQAETGSYAYFSVVATGTRPLRYQWQRNGVNIAGATYPSLFISPVGSGDTASYTVVVSNAAGSVTSAAATLTVSVPTAPAISAAPVAVSVAEGSQASFSVIATGTAPLAYQWLRNDVEISGAVLATYTLPAATQADSGARYSVRVSNAVGSVTSAAATLTVTAVDQVAPALILQPLNATVQVGATATFAALATGSPTPTYQWRLNGTPIAGATSPSYTTPARALADSGAVYSVVVTNALGTVTSNNATLTVTSSDTDAKTALLRLMALSFDFYEAVTLPLLLTDDNAAIVSASTVCTTGSISGQYNGSALPAVGTVLSPVATLAATATACDAGGTLYNGSASLSYNLSSVTPAVGTANATATALRLRDGSGSRDITVNGNSTLTMAGSNSGTLTTQTLTVAPASGATLRNALSNLTATYAGGNVATLGEWSTATGQVVRSRVSYSDLRFAVAGVNYVASGAYEMNFSGQAFAGSGEVLLSSGGVTVGRIYANANGIFVEANGVSQALAAKRAQAR